MGRGERQSQRVREAPPVARAEPHRQLGRHHKGRQTLRHHAPPSALACDKDAVEGKKKSQKKSKKVKKFFKKSKGQKKFQKVFFLFKKTRACLGTGLEAGRLVRVAVRVRVEAHAQPGAAAALLAPQLLATLRRRACRRSTFDAFRLRAKTRSSI